MRIKISGSDGTVTAVYHDVLAKMKMGAMTVERASNVEFDHTQQSWEARTPAGELLASGPDRGAVIAEEVRILESRL